MHHPSLKDCNKPEKNTELSVSFSKTEERGDLQPLGKTRKNQAKKQFGSVRFVLEKYPTILI